MNRFRIHQICAVLISGLDGQNRAIVIAESLARVIIAIRNRQRFVGGHISPQNTGISPHRPCVRCAADLNRAIGVHSFNIRSTWNCRMACESGPLSLNASDLPI